MFTCLALAHVVAQQPNLIIDPLLMRQAAEVWSVIARKNNPVWLGWDASRTPLLIYIPGKQDVLINHPKPPADFVRYRGPVRYADMPIYIRDGKTVFEFDGQNTSTEIEGIQTLVVADSKSNLRNNLLALLGNTGPEAEKSLDSALFSNPMDSMLMFAHEAFHVFQHAKAPQKGGNELALISYPSLSVENNMGYSLEAGALREALTALDPRPAARRWLAIRETRRARLDEKLRDYEDGTEFNEGLAKYVEWKMLEILQGKKPGEDMWLIQGFKGYDNLMAERDRLLKQMVDMMTGKTIVNGDPYGASPVRMRLYYSGMGVAALLDRLGIRWKERIFQDGTSLSAIAREGIGLTTQEIQASWNEVAGSPDFKRLEESKQELAANGETHIQEVLKSFEDAPSTIVIDYSKLSKPRVGYGFTPFGILRIDEERRVFRLLPLRGLIGALTFAEDSARPVLDDSKSKQVRIMLTSRLSREVVAGIFGSEWNSHLVELKEVKLPGVSLKSVKGRLRLEGKTITLVLED